MKIAIDKNSLSIVKKDNNEYIYLYDDADYNELIKLNLHCMDYRYCDYVDLNLTDYNVECIKKAKIIDKDWYKVEKKDYKIAIIIPNFNYEHTIEKCLNSILDQTYKNYEIISVDDCSTDNSVTVAKNTYANYLKKQLCGFDSINELKKDNQFKIVQLKQKRLNGGARNEGYLYVSNDTDYIYYVDSDDWLIDNYALEKINIKLQTRPDVLFVGLASYKSGKTTTCFVPDYKDKYDAIRGWSGSCGKVIKKELATRQECLYNEGTLKEDKNQHCKICINMNSFALLQEPIYVWNRDNYSSVTTIRDEVLWGTSTIRHYADTKQLYLTYKGKDKKIDEILENRLRLCEQEMKSGGDKQW